VAQSKACYSELDVVVRHEGELADGKGVPGTDADISIIHYLTVLYIKVI
jgi:hypothetical protein